MVNVYAAKVWCVWRHQQYRIRKALIRLTKALRHVFIGESRLTVPAGLLKSHQTKEGTWDKTNIAEGKLLYRVLQSGMGAVNALVF